jgi:hypothetical protein
MKGVVAHPAVVDHAAGSDHAAGTDARARTDHDEGIDLRGRASYFAVGSITALVHARHGGIGGSKGRRISRNATYGLRDQRRADAVRGASSAQDHDRCGRIDKLWR